MTEYRMRADDVLQPAGWRILVKVPKPPEKTKGGIILSDQSQDIEAMLNNLGVVVGMGPLCFKDPKKFGDVGIWCQVGDTVMLGKYAGIRMLIDSEEYRLVNDEEVLGVVGDTNRIRRVM